MQRLLKARQASSEEELAKGQNKFVFQFDTPSRLLFEFF